MKVREVLLSPILDLLGNYVEISKEDKDVLLEHQAKLLAIHWAQSNNPDFDQKDLRKPPRFGKENSLMMDAEIKRLDVLDYDIMIARKAVVSREGMPPEVPLIGKIAVDMGIVDNDLLNALVTAQTGQLILRTADFIKDKSSDDEAADFIAGTVVESTDASQTARNFIGSYKDDTDETTSAQAFKHLADLALMIVAICPLMGKADVIERLHNIIEKVGYISLMAGANHLAEIGKLSDASDIFAEINDTDISISEEDVDYLKKFVADGCSELGTQELISKEEYDICTNLIEKRCEQADLGVLVSKGSKGQNLDLKEQLRSKLKSAK
jgi:hypothetical protein